MTQRLELDEVLNPAPARVLIEHDATGTVTSARFDLASLPRIDAMLTGRPIGDIPALVERLCSICPAAHHLAGVRALEALAGISELPRRASAVRALLHHGAGLATHAAGIPAAARFARDAQVAAGAPNYFPQVAFPGGVTDGVHDEAQAALAETAPRVIDDLAAAARRLMADGRGARIGYTGADVALVRADGTPDLLGTHLRAVAADGTLLIAAAPPSSLDSLIAEAVPASADPRPFLAALGPLAGGYRVGPIAQLRMGPLTTGIAANLQAQWLASGDDAPAAAARAIMAVHSAEEIAALLAADVLTEGEAGSRFAGRYPAGVGVGWVDGPRGLLIHRYASDGTVLTEAVLLTPTAANADWLAQMLQAAFGAGSPPDPLTIENAIRAADPCLPCSSAPEGRMGVQISSVHEAIDPAGGL